MSSQWIINNKKVKDWTIGGKKVKSLTLTNGKVINFGTTQTPQEIITIKTTDYSRLDVGYVKLTSEQQSASQYLKISGLTNGIFDSLKPKLPPEYGTVPFIINFKANAEGGILDIPYNFGNEFIISTDSYGFEIVLDKPAIKSKNTNPGLELINGHAYKFDGDKQVEDLGLFTEVAEEKIITITNTQYTVIDTSYSGSSWYALSGYTLTDTSTTFTKFVLDVRDAITIAKSTTYYDDGFSNTIFVNKIASDTFNLVAGHKYQFESGKDPLDLGEYGTTTTPPVPTGPIIKATEYVNDIVTSSGYSIRVQNIQNDYFKQITTAGYTGTISFDFEIRCAAPLVFNGISTFRITDIVNRNHLDVSVATGTFTLQNGHKYHIEPGKDPVDLGIY